ncbi:MAG: TetR family transcriptional regulator [Myxococcaceae bacterium]|nr:TetR family transcriptional regulator [Myxococcaceae bacterium]
MPRPSNTDERRAQIADAMIRVVARAGYERASVAEVAREAGLAAGLVHYHFQRKLDVLLAMQERLTAAHLDRVERWSQRAKTPEGRVRAFIDCHLARGAEEDPAALACWIALTAEALRDPEVRAGYDRAVRALIGRLESAVRDELAARGGDLRRARAVATAVFAAIQGYYALHGASPGLIPRGSAAPAVHALAGSLLARPIAAIPSRPVAAKSRRKS